MSNYVYIRSEHTLWTVGFYSPDGQFHPESDHDDTEKAAERVHWLNGGNTEPEDKPNVTHVKPKVVKEV